MSPSPHRSLGPTICDPAAGSAGFLCESFDYLKAQNPKRTTAQDRTLQERTFYGKEKKSLAYVTEIMNMIPRAVSSFPGAAEIVAAE